MEEEKIKAIIRERYADIARSGSCCCGVSSCCEDVAPNAEIAASIGYSAAEIGSFPDANLGLGCGNPIALAYLQEGDVVLDLGSGAGFDCFLAAKRVGATGRVIGVDMTPAMVEKARINAQKYGYTNVEFRLGDIENLPVSDGYIDVIISNCVINLAPDKNRVFREAHRVLKDGGKLYVSDIVLLEELSAPQKADPELLAGCVGGASLRHEYLEMMEKPGFSVCILGEDTEIGKRQYNGIKLSSIKVEASK